MAQINGERKRSGAWILLLVGLILFVIIVLVLVKAVDREDEEPVGPMQTSAVRQVAPEGAPAPGGAVLI